MISRKSMERFRRGDTSHTEILYYIVRHEFNLTKSGVELGPGEREAMEEQRRELCGIGARLPKGSQRRLA